MTSGPGASEPLYRLPVRLLGDMISPRALERILQDSASSRGLTLDTLDARALEDILKREVFKRLQLSVPAALAKRRVSDVIAELLTAAPAPPAPRMGGQQLGLLEEGARRFTLYFDWPETQRLRGVLGVARQQDQAGQDITPLIREGQDLIALMERRLQEGLVTQAQDLAELQAAFRRVQGMGGKDVRRLETLISQIEDAQGQNMLLPAEVDRARNITFNIRKMLESSVVQPLTPGGEAPALDPEAQARVLALEQEHTARQLADLAREFEPLMRARPDLEARLRELRDAQTGGTLKAETVTAWRTELEGVRAGLLRAQTEELDALETRLAALPDSPALGNARVELDVARLTLLGGGLATDELRDLSGMLVALEAEPARAERTLARQRELAEVERSARDVPGASAELAPQLAAAREALARGEDVNPDPLWALLERRMGEAAQQRQDFDARADHVIQEYDTVRHLAGETIKSLGRLADALRAQRRLGPMSAEARERYAQTLGDAEGLLTEAHAEYRAAQEVTASFGADALSGLLDVFDFGGGDSGESGGGGLFGDVFGGAQTPPPAAPAPAPAAPASAAPALPDDTWLIRAGRITAGSTDMGAQDVAALLDQAIHMGARTLRLEDERGAWFARQDGLGAWRLARGPNLQAIEDRLGHWLATGEAGR